jgi:putative heme-binding domain-containing protein
MRSLLVGIVLLVLFILPVSAQKPNVAPSDPLGPAAARRTFRLPPGFEIQLVAAEPEIRKPLNIAFDDQGRLWVTDTVEYPYAAKPGRKPHDSVKVLEDFGPDGRARKITEFADGLNIPIGILPLPGSSPREAVVFSIPNVYRLQDSTGRGRADKRELLYSGYGTADTHGMTNAFTLGFDGWVYATHGFANQSTIKGKAGQAISLHSGNTYRFQADGSRVEQWTWGQVNPFGLSFDPWGNLYSADCHSQPIYQLLRGGYYPSFGKPHDGLGYAPEMFTGYKGSTAIAGIAFYAADGFPARYRQSAFIGDVMTNQIIEFKMTWQGSTPKATADVFLDSTDLWFRPVDIKLGPDGALYVADFYNRIIGHYEVPLTHPDRDRVRGRIWRIVWTGRDHKGTPSPRRDWTKATVKELLADLHHPNLTVRLLATQQLVHRGKKESAEATRAVLKSREDVPRRAERDSHALWVLERLGALNDETLNQAARGDALVRNHVMRILAGRKSLTAGQRKLVLAGLKDSSANVQRAAADALGQHPAAANLQPLLELRHKVPAGDAHLLYVVRMSLRNQLRPGENWKPVMAERWSNPDLEAITDVALGVGSPESARYLLSRIEAHPPAIGALVRLVHHIARYADGGEMKGLLKFCMGSHPTDLGYQAELVRAFDRGTKERGAKASADFRSWATEVTDQLLSSKNAGEVQRGAELTALLRFDAQQARLVALATAVGTSEAVRQAALNALAAIDAIKHAATLGKVVTGAAMPLSVRLYAAGLLARANQAQTRAQLIAALPTAPAHLQHGIAEGLAASHEGGEKLLELVASGKASARLLQERAVTVRLENARLPDLKKRLEKLTAGLPAADAKLQALIAARRKGFLAAKTDLAKGAVVFEKSCANCHQLGGKGAKVGPQLDGIGLRGLDRLLEDTLDPNRNVDQAFRLTSLTMKKGQIVQGLLLREEGAVLVLADEKGKEVRVQKKDVEERSVSQMSPMPANLGTEIPEADFYHLLAYLLAQKPAKP